MKRAFLIFFISLIIAKIFIVKASADLNDGLIAYYPFNGNAIDESGNGYNGTVIGATLTVDRFGKVDKAYSFDGTNDYIDIGTEPNFPSWDSYAVSVWFLNDGMGNQGGYGQKIISKNTFYTDFYLTVYGNANEDPEWRGALYWMQREGPPTPFLERGIRDNSTNFTDNAWHHVVVTKDGSHGEMWVDGRLAGSSDTITSADNTVDLLIGYSASEDHWQRRYWSGKIDDIYIYNRILSELEIQQLYNGPITIRIPEDAAEGDGVLEDQGMVSVLSVPDTDLVINLSSDDTSLVAVPETVTIHTDANNATFDLTVLDNCINNGSQNVTITASASGYISGSDTIQVADNDVSVDMDLPLGWSMISLPVTPCNGSVSSLFSEAKTVYGYERDTGYVRVKKNKDLEVGKGYWILLDQNQSYTLTGEPILSYKQTLYEPGWEMAGGCTYSANASTDGCNIGVIYEYLRGTGYQRVHGSEKLEPGKGYWMLFRDIAYQVLLNKGFPCTGAVADFCEIVSVLDYPVVMSTLVPYLQEVITFIRKDEYEFKELSKDQSIIKLFSELSFEQQEAYKNFDRYTRAEIAKTRRIDKNDNELLFPEERRHLYNSPNLEEINNTNLQMLYGQDCPFELTEHRKASGDRFIISSSSMTIKSNEQVTLKEGLYFFESLALEKNSIINTDGGCSDIC